MYAKNNDAYNFFAQVNHIGRVCEFAARPNGHDIDGAAKSVLCAVLSYLHLAEDNLPWN